MDENDRIACGIEKKVSVRGGAPSGVLNVASGERLIYSTKAIIIAARREVDANRLKRGPLFILFFFCFSLRFWLSSFHSLFQVFLSFNSVSSFLPFRDHIHIVLFFKWLNPTGEKKTNETKQSYSPS